MSFISFKEAERARISLKMKLSNYAWYKGSSVADIGDEGYCIIISVAKLDNSVRKIIPAIVGDGVSIKTEME